MRLPCPNPACGAEVELDFDQGSNGDGPWLQTWTVAYVASQAGPNGDDACEGGCLLTPEQVRQLEQDALEDALDTEWD